MFGSFEQAMCLFEVAESVFQTPRGFEGLLIIRFACENLLVKIQSIVGSAGLLQQLREGQGEAYIIGSVAARDEQLGSCAAQIVMCDQVTRQFETEVAPANDSIPLPRAVDRPAIVVDCGLHIVLLRSEARETKIDEAVAGLGLPQAEEVVVGLLRMAGVGQRLGEQKFVRALAWRVRHAGAIAV